MEVVTIVLPTIAECKFKIQYEQSDVRMEGSFASGDDDMDRELIKELQARLKADDIWAWCDVDVTCEWRGMTGTDSLGACSYRDEDEFKAGGYYEDMQEAALADIHQQIRNLAKQNQYSVEGNEPVTLSELLQINGEDIGAEDEAAIRALKIGESYHIHISEIKRVA